MVGRSAARIWNDRATGVAAQAATEDNMTTQHIIRLPGFATIEEAQAFADQHGGQLKLEPQRDADGRVRGIVIVGEKAGE